MANQEHLDILAQGVEVWNEWVRADLFPFDLRGANLAAADLRHIKLFSGFLDGANLERADLTGADLRSTSMSAVNLRGAKLNGAIMTYCGLQSADLTDAELFLTNLSDANLRDSTLTNAGLIQTNLDRGDLRRADLTAARLNGAILTRANLTDAITGRALLVNGGSSACRGGGATYTRSPWRAFTKLTSKMLRRTRCAAVVVVTARRWGMGSCSCTLRSTSGAAGNIIE